MDSIKPGEQFTKNGYLEKNLRAVWEKRVQQQDKDVTFLVVGAPGTTKSTLSYYIMLWLEENIDPVTFTFDHLSLDHEQWIENEQEKLEKYAASWYDEGRDTFNRRNAMSSKNKEGIDHLNWYRYKHIFRVINFQNTQDMEDELLYEHADVVLRCVKQGRAWAYSKHTAQNISIDTSPKKVKWPDPDFKVTYYDPRKVMPEKWDTYENKRESRMDKRRNRKKQDNQRTVTCQECGHAWSPRVDVPRQCPECNTRKWNKRVS